GIEIWGPDGTLMSVCDAVETWNDCSYVVRVRYGGRSLVLPGDAGVLEWESICDSVGDSSMASDILKAAHHGRDSGYSERATSAMSPLIVICSVGKKPETDASDDYASQGAMVVSTRYQGTINVEMWSTGEVRVYNHKYERIALL